MQVTQISPNLWQLTRLGAFNCQLVREGDQTLTLIDTGLPGSADAILKAAASIGAPITRILLTHAHGDHVGSLDALASRLPGVEVVMSQRESRIYEGDKSLDAGEPRKELRGMFPRCNTRLTRRIGPCERVGSFDAIATPGHTPGHFAFFDRRDRTLFAGDALFTIGGVAVAGLFRLTFPFPAMATWDKATALHSAQSLRGLEPARLIVGHGRVVSDPVAEMDRAIATAEQVFKV